MWMRIVHNREMLVNCMILQSLRTTYRGQIFLLLNEGSGLAPGLIKHIGINYLNPQGFYLN